MKSPSGVVKVHQQPTPTWICLEGDRRVQGPRGAMRNGSELNVILGRSEAEIGEAMPSNRRREIGGAVPLAEQITQDDPYMSKQAIMDSGPTSFAGRLGLREDAFFVRNSFERQLNTLNRGHLDVGLPSYPLETNTDSLSSRYRTSVIKGTYRRHQNGCTAGRLV